MFLFAKLVLRHLDSLNTKEDVLGEIAIYGFPDGLEKA